MICSIPLEKITRNPNQPRQDFPPDYIKELAASIKQRGLIQPITVRRAGKDRFMIVDRRVPFPGAQADRRQIGSMRDCRYR